MKWRKRQSVEDLPRLRTANGDIRKPCLYVAIDRYARFVHLDIYDAENAVNAITFLKVVSHADIEILPTGFNRTCNRRRQPMFQRFPPRQMIEERIILMPIDACRSRPPVHSANLDNGNIRARLEQILIKITNKLYRTKSNFSEVDCNHATSLTFTL